MTPAAVHKPMKVKASDDVDERSEKSRHVKRRKFSEDCPSFTEIVFLRNKKKRQCLSFITIRRLLTFILNDFLRSSVR